MADIAIAVQHVSKNYRIYDHPRHRLLEALWRGRRCYHRDFWALRDVSVEVPRGQTLGIIGLNGSGKSTLLQMIAGIVQPTLGHLTVHGRLASLLELGAGFNPEFTGRENVLMQAAILGLERADIVARLPLIEAFAEIGTFIDQPVKAYSSGMFVRLAFAAAIHTDPDVLLVDEALAVGDAIFQHRCIRKIREFHANGKTLCFVSHDTDAVKAICTRALFLEAGEVRAIGRPDEVVNRYHAHIANLERRAIVPTLVPQGSAADAPAAYRPDPDFDRRVALFRHGTGAARITNVEVLDADSRPLAAVEFDQEIILRIHVEFYEDVEFSILGYFFRDRNGIDVIGTNTCEKNTPIPPRTAGDTLVVDFRQRLPLAAGTYSVTAGLAYGRDVTPCLDWVDNALILQVLSPPSGEIIHARIGLPVQIAVHT